MKKKINTDMQDVHERGVPCGNGVCLGVCHNLGYLKIGDIIEVKKTNIASSYHCDGAIWETDGDTRFADGAAICIKYMDDVTWCIDERLFEI